MGAPAWKGPIFDPSSVSTIISGNGAGRVNDGTIPVGSSPTLNDAIDSNRTDGSIAEEIRLLDMVQLNQRNNADVSSR